MLSYNKNLWIEFFEKNYGPIFEIYKENIWG